MAAAALALAAALLAAAPAAAAPSKLWGAAGEAWNPAGRLPDFSFAGRWRHHANETHCHRACASKAARLASCHNRTHTYTCASVSPAHPPPIPHPFAGYRQGNVPLPTPPATRSVADFRRPGGSDTQMLQDALAWAHAQPVDPNGGFRGERVGGWVGGGG